MARRNRNINQDNQYQDINADNRVEKALELRRMGYDYSEIAKRCGYADASGAFRAVDREIKKIQKDGAQALVQIQVDQIDLALTVVMEKINQHDKESLWAVDRLVPLLKRKSDLLGLDAKTDMVVGATIVREVGADLSTL
jgi:hypothetical protein